MNFTLHQLQVFLKVTQNKSITKAADELFLTQPAVSIQLKNFQDQFEIPLTEVIGRQLYITDFGKEIAKAAENILNEVYAINYKTLAYKGVLSGKLKLSVVSTGKYVLPYYISDFLQMNPGLELDMDVTNKTKVIEGLKNNEVDFAMVSLLPEGLLVEKEELFLNKLFLVSGATSSVDESPVNLQDQSLLYREDGSATRLLMEQYLKKIGVKSSVKKIQLTSNEAVKQAVIAGLGLSVMPLIGLKNELEKKLIRIVPHQHLPIVTTWQLIWMKGKEMSPSAKAFLSYIRAEKSNIFQKNFEWTNDY